MRAAYEPRQASGLSAPQRTAPPGKSHLPPRSRTRGRMTGRWASTSRATSITEVSTRAAWSFRACAASSRVRRRRWARTLAASRSSRSSRSRSRSRPVRATVPPALVPPRSAGAVASGDRADAAQIAAPADLCRPPRLGRSGAAEVFEQSGRSREGNQEIPGREWMERARTVPRGGPPRLPSRITPAAHRGVGTRCQRCPGPRRPARNDAKRRGDNESRHTNRHDVDRSSEGARQRVRGR